MLRSLALLVAVITLVQLAASFILVGPHSDMPGQPFTSLLVVVVVLAGFVLAGALWRRRAAAATWLPVWGAALLAFALVLMLVISSPTERAEAWPAFAVGAPVWAFVVWRLTGWVRRRTAASGDPA